MTRRQARDVRAVLRGLAVTTTAARDLPEVCDAAVRLDVEALAALGDVTLALPPSWHQASQRRGRLHPAYTDPVIR